MKWETNEKSLEKSYFYSNVHTSVMNERKVPVQILWLAQQLEMFTSTHVTYCARLIRKRNHKNHFKTMKIKMPILSIIGLSKTKLGLKEIYQSSMDMNMNEYAVV